MPAVAVLYFFGWVFALLAAFMLLPLGFSLITGEDKDIWSAFLLTIIGLVFLSGAILIALHGRSAGRNRRAALFMLGAVWVFVPIVAALPLYLSGIARDMVSAYFEAVSGFTTTGATIFAKVGELPRSIILWRAELQWLGGGATYLALAVLLGPLAGRHQLDWELKLIGGTRLEFADQVILSLRTILPIYAGLTFYCFLGLFVTGIPSFEAFCLALSTVSTGGFMPRDGTITLYGAPYAELVLTLFMFLGAVSVIWVRAMLKFQWSSLRSAPEPLWVAGSIIGLGIVLAVLNLKDIPGAIALKTVFHTLTSGLASAASLISTTGFIVSDSGHFHMSFLALLVVCLIGGGRFSTAGGLKLYRVAAMVRQSWREFKFLIYPHGVRPNRFGREAEDMELMKGIWATFAVIITSIWVLALFLSISMPGDEMRQVKALDVPGALMAALSAISNIGPAYKMLAMSNLSSLPEIAQFSSAAKLGYSAGMILGRVEILALLGLLNLAYWRS